MPPTATAVFFGASYHADYATILAAPGRPAGRRRCAGRLPRRRPASRRPWDVVDLRRLRCGDPAADALAAAFGAREMAEGWTLNVEREDVCPVVTLPDGRDDRRLPRDARQEGAPRDPAQGPPGGGRRRDPASTTRPTRSPTSRPSSTSTRSAGASTGLFPPTRRAARRVASSFRRLFELHGADGPLRLTFLTVGGRRIAAGHPLRDRRRLPLLQRRRRPRRARPVAGRADGLRATSSARSRRAAAGSTSCAATSPTSTSGAPSTSRSSACSSGERVGR